MTAEVGCPRRSTGSAGRHGSSCLPAGNLRRRRTPDAPIRRDACPPGATVTLLAPRLESTTPARDKEGLCGGPALPAARGTESGGPAHGCLPGMVSLHLVLATAKQTKLRLDLRRPWPPARISGGGCRKVARQACRCEAWARRRNSLRPLRSFIASDCWARSLLALSRAIRLPG